MSDGPSAQDFQESVEELRDYLADGIPPLLAAGAVGALIRGAPDAITSQIQSWLSFQYRARGRAVGYSDLAYHALSKLHLLGELGLLSKRELASYLDVLVEALLPLCPPAERELVRTALERLRLAPAEIAGSAFRIGRAPAAGLQPDAGEAPAGGAGAAELTQELRRFALLLERLKPAAAPGGAPGPPAGAAGDPLIASVLAAAATTARDGSELTQYLQHLRELGVLAAEPAAVVRTLSRAVPNWAPAAATSAEELGGNARALRRLVDLAEGPQQRIERFRELVHSVVAEFNAGSLARAVALAQVAAGLLAEGKVPVSDAELVRGSAHEALDAERLRGFAVDPPAAAAAAPGHGVLPGPPPGRPPRRARRRARPRAAPPAPDPARGPRRDGAPRHPRRPREHAHRRAAGRLVLSSATSSTCCTASRARPRRWRSGSSST